MPNRLTIPLIGLSLLFSLHETARAEPAQERVALMLSGPGCASSQHTIATILQEHTGVLHVDMDLMPDHVLIDILRQHLTDDELAALANRAIGGNQCRADIMKSCITAEPPGRHADSLPLPDGQTHSH